MKRLIMCEGPNELEIMQILLENDALVFAEDDLLGLTPYHARQIKSSPQVRLALNLYFGNDVLVMRVGDKQTDKLTIPADYRERISHVEKYCTLPELEMLLIISEGLVQEYDKVKSKINPKAFAKEHLRNLFPQPSPCLEGVFQGKHRSASCFIFSLSYQLQTQYLLYGFHWDTLNLSYVCRLQSFCIHPFCIMFHTPAVSQAHSSCFSSCFSPCFSPCFGS